MESRLSVEALGTTKIGKFFHTGNMGFPQVGDPSQDKRMLKFSGFGRRLLRRKTSNLTCPGSALPRRVIWNPMGTMIWKHQSSQSKLFADESSCF
jgi:hypothetical protein